MLVNEAQAAPPVVNGGLNIVWVFMLRLNNGWDKKYFRQNGLVVTQPEAYARVDVDQPVLIIALNFAKCERVSAGGSSKTDGDEDIKICII